MDRYKDIIDIEHWEPNRHKRMSMYQRAAQFAPFAALKGHEEAMDETRRQNTKNFEAPDIAAEQEVPLH